MYNDHPPLNVTSRSNRRPLKVVLIVVTVLIIAAVIGYFASMALSGQLATNAVKDEIITQNQRLKAGKENDSLTDAAIASVVSTDRATVTLAVATDRKTYCIEATSLNSSKEIAFHMDGDTPELEPKAGLCGEAAENTPAKVTGLTVGSNAAGAVSLAWDAIPDALQYRLECSTVDTFASVASFAEVSGTTGVVSNLKEAGGYYCRVAAKNSKGQGDWADSVAATTTVLLTWPQGLEAKALSTTSISYSWKPVSGVKQYILEYAKDVNFTKDVVKIPTTQASGTITGLTKFTVYYFHVKAVTQTASEVQAPFSPAVQGRTNE